MKKNFKFTSVALGLLVLASCSNEEDFFSNEAVASQTSGDAVNVVVEDLYPGTRSAHTASKGIKWIAGDQMRIYDAELSKYDTYEYDGTSKYSRKYATQRVANENITYAVFPGNLVSWTNFDEGTADVKAVMTLPDKIVYNGSSEKDFSGTLAYLSNIPMQGAAEYSATYGANMPSMKYMTGIVAITLDNVQSKATWLKLEAGATEYLAGSFEATLTDATPILAPTAESDVIKTPSNVVYVNITNAPRSRAIVYLPVIAQTYNDLAVSYTTDAAVDANGYPTGAFTVIKDFAPAAATVTVPRAGSVSNSVLEANYDFQLDTHTPEALSTVLSDRASVTGTLNLNIDYLEFSVDEGTSTDAKWFTIKVPNMKADVVNIKMPTGIKNDVLERSQLVIADADDSNPFTGTIVLDLGNAGTIQNNTTDLGVTANLDKATLTLVGDWSDADGGITVTKANAFIIGDGTTATTIDDALTLTEITSSMTVEANATVNTPVTVPATSSAFTFDVKGTISQVTNARIATVTISGAGKVAATMATLGQVTINRSTEGLAIGQLQLNGENQEVALKCGYISTINTSLAADSKKSATLYNEETGVTGIGTINVNVTTLASGAAAPASYKLLLTFAGSKWAGAKGDYTTYGATYYATGNIYTASQLATIDGDDADYKLWNNVDLDSKSWVGVDLQKNFDGQGFTISNLNLTELAENAATTSGAVANNGIGLFASTSGTTVTSIKNFTLSTVAFDQPANVTTGASQKYYKYANIGAVVGKDNATSNLTYEHISVTGATFAATNRTDINAVGGLIGSVADGAGTRQIQYNNVTASITGYYALGGAIGSDDNDDNLITIWNNTWAPTFTVNKSLPADKQSDVNYGKVGDLVGTISITGASVRVDAGNNITSGIASKKEALKFRQHKNYYINGDEVQEQYYFGCQSGNNWVGFSATGATLNAGGTAQNNKYTANANSVAGTDTRAWNYFVLDASTVTAKKR